MDEYIIFTNPNADQGNASLQTGSEYVTGNIPDGGNKRRGLVWIIILTSLVIITAITALLISAISKDVKKPGYVGGDSYIGELHIEGTMTEKSDSSATYQQKWLLEQVDNMMKDESNKGILLYIDSPGGEVYAADELYLKLKEYKDTTKRPVHAYYASLAASGAYYISAQADNITANRNCRTGSIGVYMGPVIDATGLLEKAGIRAQLIKSSSNKAIGSYFEPFTDEHKAIIQSQVDETYETFVNVVAEGRGMSTDAVKVVADGRTYTAKQAKNVGLIDDIGDLDAAKESMLKAVDEDYSFETISYQPENNFYSSLLGMSRNKQLSLNLTDAQLAMKLISEQQIPKPMMMMQ